MRDWAQANVGGSSAMASSFTPSKEEGRYSRSTRASRYWPSVVRQYVLRRMRTCPRSCTDTEPFSNTPFRRARARARLG